MAFALKWQIDKVLPRHEKKKKMYVLLWENETFGGRARNP